MKQTLSMSDWLEMLMYFLMMTLPPTGTTINFVADDELKHYSANDHHLVHGLVTMLRFVVAVDLSRDLLDHIVDFGDAAAVGIVVGCAMLNLTTVLYPQWLVHHRRRHHHYHH